MNIMQENIVYIEGYAEMSDDELQSAVEWACDECAAIRFDVEGYAEISDTKLQNAVAKLEYYARRFDVDGYAEMSDDELRNTVQQVRNERDAKCFGIEGHAEMSNDELQSAVEWVREFNEDDSDVSSDEDDSEINSVKLTPLESKEPCPLCLDVIAKVVATLCKHTFHEECIKEWAIKSIRCSLCRQSLQHREY